jgi:hypothetical protein
MQWGDKHTAGPDGAPRVVVHTKCEHDAQPVLHCSHCGEELKTREMRIRPGPGASERQRAEPLLPA